MKIEYSRPKRKAGYGEEPRTETLTIRLSPTEKDGLINLTGAINEGRYRYIQLSQADVLMRALELLKNEFDVDKEIALAGGKYLGNGWMEDADGQKIMI